MPTVNVERATSATNVYTYVVPTGVHASLSWASLDYTSDATVGNRQIAMEVLDSADAKLFSVSAGAVQAASLTRDYEFLQGIYRETSFVDGEIQVAVPNSLVIKPGQKLKFYDSANISAADTMLITLQYNNVAQKE